MNKILLIHFFLFVLLLVWSKNSFSQTPGEWTWMHGSNVTNNPSGVFGIKGTPSSLNDPPGFYEPSDWTDTQGNFWLFGGYNGGTSSGVYGDVWRFNPITLQWTWMHGTSLANPPAVYGTQGTPSPANSPGGQQWCSATWRDNNGNFWLFGGSDGGGSHYSLLWKYDPLANEWTWMNGPTTQGAPGIFGTIGVPSSANYPTSRWETNATWTDANNNLWLYGGLNASGDMLWKYDIATNMWTWMKGSSTAGTPLYGTLQVSSPSNTPGYRQVYCKWKDTNGDFWLFGGSGSPSDLWKYSIATNEWTWMGGDSLGNSIGNYGPKCISSTSYLPLGRYENRACWTDNYGNFWSFGGYGSGPQYNDLWKYCPVGNQWTWINGSQVSNVSGVYGTMGISSPLNYPGARMGSIGWKDASGNLWMWGGWAGGFYGANDLWRFVIDTACGTSCLSAILPIANFNSNDSAVCAEGSNCINFFDHSSNNATTWEWHFPGAFPDSSALQNPVNICYGTPGTYPVTLIVTNSAGTDTLTVSPMITVGGAPTIPVITIVADTLFSSSSASYQWYYNGSAISGATDSFYVALQNGTYAVLVTDSIGCSSLSSGVLWTAVAEFGVRRFALRIYPNPSHGVIQISMNKVIINGEVNVFDVLGNKVYSTFFSGNQKTINTKLSPGIYFVKVYCENVSEEWNGKIAIE